MIGLDDKRLKPAWALEIKWSNRYVEKPDELKSLLQFCHKNGLKSALVTTTGKEAAFNFDGIDLTFVPAAMYAYTVGANTIEHKKKKGF
jgi:hypothetical protein